MDDNDKIQMPSGGCQFCGRFDGFPQRILRKRLYNFAGTWLCKHCYWKAWEEEAGVEENIIM